MCVMADQEKILKAKQEFDRDIKRIWDNKTILYGKDYLLNHLNDLFILEVAAKQSPIWQGMDQETQEGMNERSIERFTDFTDMLR